MVPTIEDLKKWAVDSEYRANDGLKSNAELDAETDKPFRPSPREKFRKETATFIPDGKSLVVQVTNGNGVIVAYRYDAVDSPPKLAQPLVDWEQFPHFKLDELLEERFGEKKTTPFVVLTLPIAVSDSDSLQQAVERIRSIGGEVGNTWTAPELPTSLVVRVARSDIHAVLAEIIKKCGGVTIPRRLTA
jgi:hypothetical protein